MSSRVKNLRGTSGCPHYVRVQMKLQYSGLVGCAVNDCRDKGNASCKINQCHVIKCNQNAESGVRYLVPMCTSHNMNYNDCLVVDGRIEALAIDGCSCGY